MYIMLLYISFKNIKTKSNMQLQLLNRCLKSHYCLLKHNFITYIKHLYLCCIMLCRSWIKYLYNIEEITMEIQISLNICNICEFV